MTLMSNSATAARPVGSLSQRFSRASCNAVFPRCRVQKKTYCISYAGELNVMTILRTRTSFVVRKE